MSARVVALPGVKAPEGAGPDPDLVAHVEELLAQVRSGQIVGMAVALATVEGHARTAWGPDHPPEGTTVALSAAVSILHHRFMAGVIEGSIDTPPAEPA